MFSSLFTQYFEINLWESQEVKINDIETKQSPEFIIDLDTQDPIVQWMLKRFTDMIRTEDNRQFESRQSNYNRKISDFNQMSDDEKKQYIELHWGEPQAPTNNIHFNNVDIDKTPARIRTATYDWKQEIMFSATYTFTDSDWETFTQWIARKIWVPGDCGIKFGTEAPEYFVIENEVEKEYINSLVDSTCNIS